MTARVKSECTRHLRQAVTSQRTLHQCNNGSVYRLAGIPVLYLVKWLLMRDYSSLCMAYAEPRHVYITGL